jgi:hypothetical protein
LLLLLVLFGQVDQQDVPITGQPTQSTDEVVDKAKTKKERKRSNHQMVIIKNQQNYFNPYQATSILLQVSNERVNSFSIASTPHEIVICITRSETARL